ncbi:MAG: hypothetical protein HGJ94_18295 [Desulfosarcina sp.]|nr:hypothetical protein [Desulfosarcina sp.]
MALDLEPTALSYVAGLADSDLVWVIKGGTVYKSTIATLLAVEQTLNILNPADDSWQGKTVAAVAGESMAAADQWKVLYCKDTGSGTRFYFYDADSADPDNDTYSPIALLHSSGTYSAGDAIVVTVGDGILANDGWAAAQAQVGTGVFCSDVLAGGILYSAPSGAGDHIKQIGTVLNIAANGRDVFDISFRYPDWTV